MVDQIILWTVSKDVANNILQYDISYDVEYAGKTNNYCVVVKAEELTDPTDVVEVKTKANLKAKDVKDAWVATLPAPVQENDVTQEGSVTL